MQHEQLALFPESDVAPAGRPTTPNRIVPLGFEGPTVVVPQLDILPFDESEVTL